MDISNIIKQVPNYINDTKTLVTAFGSELVALHGLYAAALKELAQAKVQLSSYGVPGITAEVAQAATALAETAQQTAANKAVDVQNKSVGHLAALDDLAQMASTVSVVAANVKQAVAPLSETVAAPEATPAAPTQ